MAKLFKYFSFSLAFMLVGFLYGLFLIPEEIVLVANGCVVVLLIGLLIFAVISKLFKRKSRGLPRFSMGWTYGVAFLEGILLYPSLVYYLQSLGVTIFLTINVGALLLFSVLAFAGSKSKPVDMKVSVCLFALLVVVIIMSLVNLLLGSSLLSTVLSALSLIIFCVYVFVDINDFKQALAAGMITDDKCYSIYVLNLFLDYINILMDILHLADSFSD